MASGKCSLLSMVFAVVMVLVIAVVLFPVFFHERIPAGRSVCMSNLKQCGQALLLYADDNNSTLPSSRLVSHASTWSRKDYLTFGTKRGRLPAEPGTVRRTWSQILYDYMRNKDIMFCPSDSVDKDGPNPTVSYWYKLANDKAWYGEGCLSPRRRVSDFIVRHDDRFPEINQIAFYEHSSWHYSSDPKAGLKNGFCVNVVHMDTYVEWVELANATSGDPENCAANSDGEPMYYNCRVDPKTGKERVDKGPAKQIDPTYCYDKL